MFKWVYDAWDTDPSKTHPFSESEEGGDQRVEGKEKKKIYENKRRKTRHYR